MTSVLAKRSTTSPDSSSPSEWISRYASVTASSLSTSRRRPRRGDPRAKNASSIASSGSARSTRKRDARMSVVEAVAGETGRRGRRFRTIAAGFGLFGRFLDHFLENPGMVRAAFDLEMDDRQIQRWWEDSWRESYVTHREGPRQRGLNVDARFPCAAAACRPHRCGMDIAPATPVTRPDCRRQRSRAHALCGAWCVVAACRNLARVVRGLDAWLVDRRSRIHPRTPHRVDRHHYRAVCACIVRTPDVEHLADGLLTTLTLYAYPLATRRALPLIWIASGFGVWLFARPRVHVGVERHRAAG